MDQRRVATGVGGSNDTSNMRSKEQRYRTEYGVVLDDRGSTDTYDSEAEARAAATAETPLVRIVTSPLDDPSVQPPTREQIDAAVGYVLFNVNNYPEAARTRIMGRDVSPLREKVADAVLALFPQPAPSAGPRIDRVPVPRVWLERLMPMLHEHADAAMIETADRALDGTIARMIAEPVSIADMAPGTTFTAVFHGEQDRFFRCRDSLARAGRYLVSMDAIDPSTIRDVTPPPATPEEGDRG